MKNYLSIITRGLFAFLAALSLSSFTVLPLKKISEKGVELSHLPGAYEKAIHIGVNAPSDIKLFYSLNGSFPSINSSRLNGSLKIDSVKAIMIALVRNNVPTDTFYAGTYIVGFKSVLPVTTLILPNEDLFSEQTGIYVGGRRADGSLWGNCWKRNMEKAVFFEHFDNGIPVLAQQCALSIFGGMTRENEEKSMRVIAKGKYGKGKFKYKMFPTKEVNSFNSLVLRTSGNDLNRTRFLDMMVSSIAKDLDIDYLAYKPSVLFVNGQYWGIHNIREKNGIDYLKENHGADEVDTDLIREYSSLEHGSTKKYQKLLASATALDPGTSAFIDSMKRQMDIDNYLRYSILQIHIVNVDSRGNVRFWRSGSVDDKFRWIYYDGDLSFSSPGLNFLEKKISAVQTDWYNPEWTTVLLRRLLVNKEIRHQFITDYSFYLSTIFNKDSLKSRILYFRDWLSPEIDRHVKRRNFNQSRETWELNVNRLIDFAAQREVTAVEHLKLNFNLGERYNLSIVNEDSSGYIYINKNKISSFPYTGKFFRNISFHVSAKPSSPQYRFVQWADGDKNSDRVISGNQNGDLLLKSVFAKVGNSALQSDIRIRAFGKGNMNSSGFLMIESDKKVPENIYIVNAIHDTISSFALEKGTNVICADSNAFRSEFPHHNYTVILSPSFDATALYQHDYFLLDQSGDIIEFIEVKSSFSNAPYIVKNGLAFEGYIVKPDLNKKTDVIERDLWKIILAVLATLLFIAGAIFFYRRNKQITLAFLALTLSNYSFSQLPLVHAQKIDPAVLLKTGVVDTSKLITTDCFEYICNYNKSDKPLSWIKPFDEVKNIPVSSLKRFKISYYKEVSTLSVLHPRLKTTNSTVELLIPGIRQKQFLIDSLKGEYLLEVEHSNSLRSWYYPIIPIEDININAINSMVGYASGDYYFQLRYKNRSFDIMSIINEKGIIDHKGIFVENYSDKEIPAAMRVIEFQKNFRKDIWNVNINHDFSGDLEREINKN